MIDNVPSDVSTSEGTFVYDVLSPVSQEIAQSEIQLDQVLNMVFAQSAEANGYSEQLRLRCAEFGVIPKLGIFATVSVEFVGTETTPIPSGWIVQTSGGLQYTTTEAGVITNGKSTVNVQAAEIGSVYNVPSSTITEIPTAINGITGVNNPAPASGGTDDETDDALLARFLLQVQSPATSGNVAQYYVWASEVPGIYPLKVIPLWNGNGTVKVIAVDTNMQPLTSDLLTALSTYVESQRPIGATVTYESAAALPIDIVVSIVQDTAYTIDQIQASITSSITDYLKDVASKKQNYVSYANIGSLIFSVPGVTDYSNLTVNGGTVNIVIGDEQVATMGTVTTNAT